MYRNEGIKRGRWTAREREEFERLLQVHGKEWKKISALLKTRTVVQVRTHAQKYFKKLAKTTGNPVLSTSKKQGLYVPSSVEKVHDSNESSSGRRVQNMHIHESPMSSKKTKELTYYTDDIQVSPRDFEPISISLIGLPPEKSSELGKRRRSNRLSRKWSTVTPRTMAAATILAAPHIRKNSDDTGELQGNLEWAVATLSGAKPKRQIHRKTHRKRKKV